MKRATFAVDDRGLDEHATVLLLADQLGGWKFFPHDRFELRFILKTSRKLSRSAISTLRRLLWILHRVHPDVTLAIESLCPSPLLN